MLLVMLGICIIVFIISLRKYIKSKDYSGEPLLAISGVFGALLLLFYGILGITTITFERVYPQKKAYIIQVNKELENKLYDIVLEYKDYEQDTFKNLTPENASTYIIVNYPELKSNTLVESYMQTIVENKKELQKLELEHIDNQVCKWWLYFGK